MTWLHQTIANDPQLAPRLTTDRLFPMPAGSIGCRGDLDRAASFIAEKQLFDRALWQKFAAVFSAEPKADADHGWRGEYWGKMMRGGCITYGYTQDERLLAVLTEAVTALLDTAEPDGRISTYPRADEFVSWDMWCRKYVLLGLEYFLEICPDEALSTRVREALCREADGILAAVGKGEGQKRITETSQIWEGVNSSSVLEPMVRLYFITQDRRYLDFAAYVVEEGGALTENIFEVAWRDEKSPYDYRVVKAYETMSCFEGLIEYYRATGIEKWRDAAVRFGRRVAAEEASLIGNCGTLHEIFDHGSESQWRTVYLGVMQETCVAVTYLKFCFQLLCLTGDSRFGDEIERTAYNALLGAINYDGAGPLPFDSYAPLNGGVRGLEVGGRRALADGTFYGCCAAIGSAGTGLAPQTAALLREDGVAVNLYLPGFVATATPSGLPLELTIKTDYPGNGAISIQIDTHDEQPFTLALRIPAWSRRTTLTVCGEPVAVTPGTFAEIRRVFACGDTVELRFDLRGRIVRPYGRCDDPGEADQAALLFGPLALARDARTGQDPMTPPALAVDDEGFAETALSDKVTFPHFYAFEARRADGGTALFLDYASAGRTWRADSRYAVIFPTEPLPQVDLTKPLYLFKALRLDYAHSNKLPLLPPACLTVREGHVTAEPGEGTVLTPTAVRGDTCHLMAGDLCLRFDENGEAGLSRIGQNFTFVPAGRDRFFITTADGRFLRVRSSGELALVEAPVPSALFTAKNAE